VGFAICYGVYGTGYAAGELSNRSTRLIMNSRYSVHRMIAVIRIAFNPDDSCFCLRAIIKATIFYWCFLCLLNSVVTLPLINFSDSMPIMMESR